jgi:hypothetical protein
MDDREPSKFDFGRWQKQVAAALAMIAVVVMIR